MIYRREFAKYLDHDRHTVQGKALNYETISTCTRFTTRSPRATSRLHVLRTTRWRWGHHSRHHPRWDHALRCKTWRWRRRYEAPSSRIVHLHVRRRHTHRRHSGGRHTHWRDHRLLRGETGRRRGLRECAGELALVRALITRHRRSRTKG